MRVFGTSFYKISELKSHKPTIFSPCVLWIFITFFLFSSLTAWAGRPTVTLSTPPNDSLIRASVYVFGTAYVPGEPEGLDKWYLEYGAGRNPKTWLRIKEDTTPLDIDPWRAGTVVRNHNKEPQGNIANWNVGLSGYRYGEWNKNLNGIYTLRLVAVSKDGQTAETRRQVMVGEAIVRSQSGTASSSDLKCRLAIACFAFDGLDSRVVALIKQVPPEQLASCKTLTGAEESGPTGVQIYSKLPSDLEAVSAIYRIYPNGLALDPAGDLEFDYDSDEYRPKNGIVLTDLSDVLIYFWNPVAEIWAPLETVWRGKIATAKVSKIPDYVAYVALLRRSKPTPPSKIQWEARTALNGQWSGVAEPSSRVSLMLGRDKIAETICDWNGRFQIPYTLEPGNISYAFECRPLAGEKFKSTATIQQASGVVAKALSPSLKLAEEAPLEPNKPLLVYAEDTALADKKQKSRRSLIGILQNSSLSIKVPVEFVETLPGSGQFIGSIDLNADAMRSVSLQVSTSNDTFTLTLGTTRLALTTRDTTPPKVISLKSSTHPCLTYLTPSNAGSTALTSSPHNAPLSIEELNGFWKLAGTGTKPSARVANWSVPSFSTKSWTFIGFTYRLFAPAKWQLMLYSNGKGMTFNFGVADSYLIEYASSAPLRSDGEWHYWQQNLDDARGLQIDRISFGSWIKTAFLTADPAFLNPNTETLYIRDLWIGKSYPEKRAEVSWKIEESSPLSWVEWWVDQTPESLSSSLSVIHDRAEMAPVKKEGSGQFTLPFGGQWFFHLQACDNAGNKSAISSFPLLITGDQPTILFAKQGTTSVVAQEVTWEQPDGAFEIKMPGFRERLDPGNLFLQINGTKYPMKKAAWDSGSETITINKMSFSSTVPLGLDGETLLAKIGGTDLKGYSLSNTPEIKITVKSPFRLETATQGQVLKIDDRANAGQWRVCWKSPTPPWLELFPGCTNNSLVAFIAPSTKRKPWEPVRITYYWERPIKSETAGTLYWQETIDDFDTVAVDDPSMRELPIFTALGTKGEETESPTLNGKSWIYSQSGNDLFEENTIRLISLKGRRTFRMLRVTPQQAQTIINALNPGETVRLDGWLPPLKGKIDLTVPASYRLEVATTLSGEFKTSATNTLQLTADRNWIHFAVLVVPLRNLRNTRNAKLAGNFYW